MRREPEISSSYANYVLGLLFVVYVFNFIDRQVLAILLESIKRDLGVSDTAMGFLSGFAFALFYTFAGIPIARWADRGSRRSFAAGFLLIENTILALVSFVPFYMLANMCIGPMLSMTQGLVQLRMRATASAIPSSS